MDVAFKANMFTFQLFSFSNTLKILLHEHSWESTHAHIRYVIAHRFSFFKLDFIQKKKLKFFVGARQTVCTPPHQITFEISICAQLFVVDAILVRLLLFWQNHYFFGVL